MQKKYFYYSVVVLVFSLGFNTKINISNEIAYMIEAPTTKVLPDRYYKKDAIPPGFSLAQGEYQSLQIVIHKSSQIRENFKVKSTSLSNKKITLRNAVEVRLVGYIKTVNIKRWDWQKPEDIGWWPDPLLPNRSFDIPANWMQSVWVTVHAPTDAPPGNYEFEIIIEYKGSVTKIPFTVDIWNYKIPQNSMLNIAWMPSDILNKNYENTQNMFSRKFIDLYKTWAGFAFDHRIPPAADIVCGWKDEDISWPIREINGKLDFTVFNELLDFGLKRNMKEFIIAVFPRRKSFAKLTEAQKLKMKKYLITCYEHLKKKGVADMAVVYNHDEPPEDLFESCRQNYKFVKSIIPECKVYQCINDIKGVQALDGYADIWDVYIAQYAKTKLAEQKTKEVRWAVCIWPHDSPNLFTEYNGMEPRIIGWLMYKYEIKGFEYWNYFHSWEENFTNKWVNWQQGSTLTFWKKGRFAEGDGLLAYPGPDKTPVSSIRLENLLDGFEDYQLLLSVEKEDGKKTANSLVNSIAHDLNNWETSPFLLENIRTKIKNILSKK